MTFCEQFHCHYGSSRHEVYQTSVERLMLVNIIELLGFLFCQVA